MSKIVGLCFTGQAPKLSRVLLSKVQIENAFNTEEKTEGTALWDTGATASVITPCIAKKLHLLPIQKVPASTPSGSHIADVYKVNLYLPNKVKLSDIKVLSGVPANCDMLIGMDVIGLGDFAVSNYGGKTTFSFRLPSCAEIDFCKDGYLRPIVKDAQPGRNDLCPCGSGKKYKKCCGK